MDEEQEIPKPEPKISEAEIILVGLFYGVLDLIDLIPIAGDITDVIAAPMGFYYWAKGISATTFVVAEVLDLIPFVQEIPSRTIGWGIAVWLDRHPKALGKLETAIEIAGVLEGDVEGLEGENAQSVHTRDGVTYHGEDELAATAERGRLEGEGLSEERKKELGWQETGDAKPSEKTTESDAEIKPEKPSEERPALEGESQAVGEGTEEEQRAKAGEARYKELTEPEGAKNPVEEAKKKYFAAPEPTKQQTAQGNAQPNNVVSGDRFAKKQRDIQQEQETRRSKEEEERIQLKKPKPAETITEDQADDDGASKAA